MLAARRNCRFNKGNRLADSGVYSQFRGIEQGGVGGTNQRRCAAARIAGVARFDIGEDGGDVAQVAAAGQLGVTALGANERRCGDEQLGNGAWRDDGADITAIEHRAAGLGGKGALDGQECGTDSGVGGDDRGGLGIVAAHQVRVIEQVRIETLCCIGGGFGVFGGVAGEAYRQSGGTIKLAGIEMRQAIFASQRPGDGALAARGGAIDGDDEGRGVRHDSRIGDVRWFQQAGRIASRDWPLPDKDTPASFCVMAMGASSASDLLFVAGTRPEAVKLAPVIMELRARGARPVLVASGQQRELFKASLAGFGLIADHDFDIMQPGQTPADVIGALVPVLAKLLAGAQPAAVVVQGDTATAFAGAQAAVYARLPLVHVEAGLRSGSDEPFPEEMHRRAIAQLASVHFAPTAASAMALRREGITASAIHVTGNTGIDALHLMAARLAREPVLDAALRQRFAAIDPSRPLLLVTVHRRENHGDRLDAILAALAELAREAEIVFPVHPHPAITEPARALLGGRPGVHLLPPLDYPAFVWLMQRATLALTDSGGVQEEAPALGLPVLVLRDVTERREGLASGNARLIGTDTAAILAAVSALLGDIQAIGRMAEAALPYGIGDAARRICDVLQRGFGRAQMAAE